MSKDDNCPTCGRPWPKENDGRAKPWCVRIRLYDKTSMDEPEYDTDPDLAPNLPGTLIINGLPEVAHELARMAAAAHGQAPAGLGTELLMHKLKGLRPTISRRGGNAVWRVPYQITAQESDFTGDSRVQHWLARVDLERETET